MGFPTYFCVGRKGIHVTVGGQQCETTGLAVDGLMLADNEACLKHLFVHFPIGVPMGFHGFPYGGDFILRTFCFGFGGRGLKTSGHIIYVHHNSSRGM